MATKSKRLSYTVGFKLKVIEFAEKNSNRSAQRQFDVNEKLVRDWRKKKVELESLPKSRRSQRVGAKPHWPELEEKLHEWVLEKRMNGIGLSGTMVRLKAKSMARELPDLAVGFTGCTSWLHRFMNRKKLTMRQKTKIAQRLPEEFEESIVNFQRMLIRMRQKNGYEINQVGNMDETPMNFDMPPTRTMNSSGDKTVLIKTTGNEKSHFTVVLACLADGTRLKPMIIFKRKTMPKEYIPPEVLVHVHEKGWMDETGMKLWIDKVWKCRQGGLLKKKSLLVYDMFKGHLMDSIKKRLKDHNTDIAIIPGGLTSLLQPLDVSLNKPFKEHVRTLWSEWMAGDKDHEFTKGGRLKRPSITLWCQWVSKAWEQIDPAMITKSFKKCCISNALDGSEDSILFEDENESDTDPFAEDIDDLFDDIESDMDPFAEIDSGNQEC